MNNERKDLNPTFKIYNLKFVIALLFHPPFNINFFPCFTLYQRKFDILLIYKYLSLVFLIFKRRGDRVVEGARLESVWMKVPRVQIPPSPPFCFIFLRNTSLRQFSLILCGITTLQSIRTSVPCLSQKYFAEHL